MTPDMAAARSVAWAGRFTLSNRNRQGLCWRHQRTSRNRQHHATAPEPLGTTRQFR